jgi:hypothetical protein
MKLLRPIAIVLAWTFSALLIVQTAAASQGAGGKGKDAAVGISAIVLTNPSNPNGEIRAEISGGGFLTGDFVEVSWFVSGPADEHVHTEVHVEDEHGDPVIGAMVVWAAENDSDGLYQTNATYTATVLSVSAPAFTNMVWDEKASEVEASYDLVDPKFP